MHLQPTVRLQDAQWFYQVNADQDSAPNTRKARQATALKQITSLQNRRIQPGAIARGSFPSGQMARRAPRSPSTPLTKDGFIPEDNAPADAQPDANPRFARNTARPTTTRGSTPPQGQMVRAPSTLRVTRQTVDGPARGPGRARRRPRGCRAAVHRWPSRPPGDACGREAIRGQRARRSDDRRRRGAMSGVRSENSRRAFLDRGMNGNRGLAVQGARSNGRDRERAESPPRCPRRPGAALTFGP